jgi:hypothetical protein
LIRRVFAPQKLARKLVIQPDHVRFDEALIGLEQRDAVGLDQIDVRQEQLGGALLERLVHRLIDHGVRHGLHERLRRLWHERVEQSSRDGDACLNTLRQHSPRSELAYRIS